MPSSAFSETLLNIEDKKEVSNSPVVSWSHVSLHFYIMVSNNIVVLNYSQVPKESYNVIYYDYRYSFYRTKLMLIDTSIAQLIQLLN